MNTALVQELRSAIRILMDRKFNLGTRMIATKPNGSLSNYIELREHAKAIKRLEEFEIPQAERVIEDILQELK